MVHWSSETSGRARIQIPVVVAGNYQIRIRFQRKKDIDTLAINLPIGDRSCQFFIDGWYGTLSASNLSTARRRPEQTRDRIAAQASGTRVDHELLISVAQPTTALRFWPN